jgi:hypothetical protein
MTESAFACSPMMERAVRKGLGPTMERLGSKRAGKRRGRPWSAVAQSPPKGGIDEVQGWYSFRTLRGRRGGGCDLRVQQQLRDRRRRVRGDELPERSSARGLRELSRDLLLQRCERGQQRLRDILRLRLSDRRGRWCLRTVGGLPVRRDDERVLGVCHPVSVRLRLRLRRRLELQRR